jgi:hypothetical protein
METLLHQVHLSVNVNLSIQVQSNSILGAAVFAAAHEWDIKCDSDSEFSHSIHGICNAFSRGWRPRPRSFQSAQARTASTTMVGGGPKQPRGGDSNLNVFF